RVDGQRALPLIERQLFGLGPARVAGVVDQQVDPAELVEGPRDRAADPLLVGDVAGNRQRRALGATVGAGVAALTDLGRDRLDLVGRAGQQDDRAALVGQRERGRAADPPTGPGHDRDLITQAHRRIVRGSTRPNDYQLVGARLGAPDLAG